MCDACPPHPCPCTTSPNREAAMVVVKPGVWCDPCIASLIAELNYGGTDTIASCCGHGKGEGSVILADGSLHRILWSKEKDGPLRPYIETTTQRDSSPPRDTTLRPSKSDVFGRDAGSPNGSLGAP